MTGHFEFRELLLKIHDLLSNNDREGLHFLLGDDVPRNLRDDLSLGGTLRVLQALFDKAIINEQDCIYLIEALEKIRCFDASKRLKGLFSVFYFSESFFYELLFRISTKSKTIRHSKSFVDGYLMERQ